MPAVIHAFGEGFLIGFGIMVVVGVFFLIAFRKKPRTPQKPAGKMPVGGDATVFMSIQRFVASVRYHRVIWGACVVLLMVLYVGLSGIDSYQGVVLEKSRSSGSRVRKWGLRHHEHFLVIDGISHGVDESIYRAASIGDSAQKTALSPVVKLNDAYLTCEDTLWNMGFWASLLIGTAMLMLFLRKSILEIIEEEIGSADPSGRQ